MRHIVSRRDRAILGVPVARRSLTLWSPRIGSVQQRLVGGFDGTGVVGREAIFGRQAPVSPQREIIATFETLELGDQLVAQDDGRRGRQDRLGLPGLVDRSVAGFSVGWRILFRTGRNRDLRRRLRGEVGRIQIVLAGNPDQGEQRIAPGVGQCRAHPVRGGGFADRADRPVR